MPTARDVVRSTLLCALVLLACKSQDRNRRSDCGNSTSDWCKSVSGDPCAAHADKSSCRADRRCEAYPYRGESAEACRTDARCFAENCPAVGCISRCEELDESSCGREEPCFWKGQGNDCKLADHRCRWDGTRCVRTESCERGMPALPSPAGSAP